MILPGVPGTITLPPREKPSEVSGPAAQANFLPPHSPQRTPQVTLPLLQSASSPSAIPLKKRKPGRPPKPRLAPIGNQAGLSNSIPTQSDGEGSVIKKRRVVSESSSRAQNPSKEITTTESLGPKECSPRADQDCVSQHNDTRTVSSAGLAEGQEMSELACRALEEEISLRTRVSPLEGENQPSLEVKVFGSAKYVSRVLNEHQESEIEKISIKSGQILNNELLQGAQEVIQPSKLRNEEESVDIPPVDVNIKQRPIRRKRTFVGEIQRFADEAIEVLDSGNSATVAESDNGRVGNNNSKPKISKPGRPMKQDLSVLRQESPTEEISQGKKPRKTKSGMQSSRLQGYLENQPRRRGRPRKNIPTVSEGGDPVEVAHGLRPSEGDLGKQRSQIRNPRENLSMESEEHSTRKMNGKITEPPLQEISCSPRLDASPGPQIVNLNGNLPPEIKEKPSKESLPMHEVVYTLGKAYNAGLDKTKTGAHPRGFSKSKAQKRVPKKSRLQGEARDPLRTSYSSRLHVGESDTQVVDPGENTSSGTQGQLSKVSTFQGQTSYSPSTFYSALLGESECNGETVNPPKNPSSRIQEQGQKISPPGSDVNGPMRNSHSAEPSESEFDADLSQIQTLLGNLPPLIEEGRLMKSLPPVGKETGRKRVAKLNETATTKQLALLQCHVTDKVSLKISNHESVFVPTLEGIEKERVSPRTEVNIDESSVHPPQLNDPRTNQSCQSEAHPEMRSEALEKKTLSDTEAPPRERRDPPTQGLSKKRGRRKRQPIPDAELPSNRDIMKKGSKAECHFASPKSFPNPIPVSVHRLSNDRGQSATVTADPVVCVNGKCIAAVDIMAQICHEFAMNSHASTNQSRQSHLRSPLKAELKRKLEISKDGGGTLDRQLFQLVCPT